LRWFADGRFDSSWSRRTRVCTSAHLATSGPRLANFPTSGGRSRLWAPWAKLPPSRELARTPLPLGWPGGPQKYANGNYGFVYHLTATAYNRPDLVKRITSWRKGRRGPHDTSRDFRDHGGMKMRIVSSFWFNWQYNAGVFAGLGIGIVIGSLLSLGWHPAVVIPGFALSAIAQYLARADPKFRR
jgi:hypothetical protein